nr:PREDICTED: uncharacterized protein LOC106705736 isoform X2 [Latimeria chalumnae]|eukprot:XP_014351144.1 PREDICTED: uncharacterized protein LOC106705736 isoform X2 [Latimeria chalumnae]
MVLGKPIINHADSHKSRRPKSLLLPRASSALSPDWMVQSEVFSSQKTSPAHPQGPGSYQDNERMDRASRTHPDNGHHNSGCDTRGINIVVTSPEGTLEQKTHLQINRNFHHIEELVHKKWYNKLSIQHSMAELPRNLIAAVYLRVDMLRQGHYFRGVDVKYIISCLEKEGQLPQDQALKWMLNPEIKDSRGMAVISQGSEVIRLKLDKFCELADICTVKKLQRESPPFPSDDELCQIFLEQNRWKIFKGALLSGLKQAGSSNHRDRLNLRSPRPQGNRNRNSEWDFDRRGILHLTQAVTCAKKEFGAHEKCQIDSRRN